MTKQEILDEFNDINYVYNNSSKRETLSWMLDELMKEQEAKKPIYNYKKYGDYLPHCPLCEKVLPNISQYGFAKFCHRCGQEVKWK